MKHAFILSLLLLLGTNYVVALPHKVWVSAENKEAETVVAAMKARLNATERFQASENDYAELTIQILCVGLEEYNVRGAICSYNLLYRSPSAFLLLVALNPIAGIVSADDRGKIGEKIFQSFVKAATEDSLRLAKTNVQIGVSSFCSHAENAEYCKPKQPSK